jgi:hypothetical protein
MERDGYLGAVDQGMRELRDLVDAFNPPAPQLYGLKIWWLRRMRLNSNIMILSREDKQLTRVWRFCDGIFKLDLHTLIRLIVFLWH